MNPMTKLAITVAVVAANAVIPIVIDKAFAVHSTRKRNKAENIIVLNKKNFSTED